MAADHLATAMSKRTTIIDCPTEVLTLIAKALNKDRPLFLGHDLLQLILAHSSFLNAAEVSIKQHHKYIANYTHVVVDATGKPPRIMTSFKSCADLLSAIRRDPCIGPYVRRLEYKAPEHPAMDVGIENTSLTAIFRQTSVQSLHLSGSYGYWRGALPKDIPIQNIKLVDYQGPMNSCPVVSQFDRLELITHHRFKREHRNARNPPVSKFRIPGYEEPHCFFDVDRRINVVIKRLGSNKDVLFRSSLCRIPTRRARESEPTRRPKLGQWPPNVVSRSIAYNYLTDFNDRASSSSRSTSIADLSEDADDAELSGSSINADVDSIEPASSSKDAELLVELVDFLYGLSNDRYGAEVTG
jgi:hypothetical protein